MKYGNEDEVWTRFDVMKKNVRVLILPSATKHTSIPIKEAKLKCVKNLIEVCSIQISLVLQPSDGGEMHLQKQMKVKLTNRTHLDAHSSHIFVSDVNKYYMYINSMIKLLCQYLLHSNELVGRTTT